MNNPERVSDQAHIDINSAAVKLNITPAGVRNLIEKHGAQNVIDLLNDKSPNAFSLQMDKAGAEARHSAEYKSGKKTLLDERREASNN